MRDTEVWVAGVGLTRFGRFPGRSALDLQAEAALAALRDTSVPPERVDGLLVGYATTHPHLMPANVLAEYLGLRPAFAAGMSVGGATGLAMIAHGVQLVRARAARAVLVVAGENRATGQSTSDSMGVLAGVAHPDYEAALGASVPAYYALLASKYLHAHNLKQADLAPLAVQMRAHAARHAGAQYRDPITTPDVTASRPVADPLRLLDCCPVSDGAAAVLLTASPPQGGGVLVTGTGSANLHQHLSATHHPLAGARRSAELALGQAGVSVADVEYAGVYDSFTITLALLLEDLGLAPPGSAGASARDGDFSTTGRLPLNTHGGLLSYGHSGVAGGMAHLVEAVLQLCGAAEDRQVLRPGPGQKGTRPPVTALVHADGGVMSAHTTLVLSGPGRPAPARHSQTPEPAPAVRTDDWTARVPALLLDTCTGCGTHRYLPTAVCPACRSPESDRVAASGRGTVAAVTKVHRPARADDGAAPITLVLVDLEEGPQVLGRGVDGMTLGEQAAMSFPPPSHRPEEGGGRWLPVFDRVH